MEENALMIGAGAVQVGQDIFAVNVSCVLIIATIFEIYLGFSENSSSACPVVMIVSTVIVSGECDMDCPVEKGSCNYDPAFCACRTAYAGYTCNSSMLIIITVNITNQSAMHVYMHV